MADIDEVMVDEDDVDPRDILKSPDHWILTLALTVGIFVVLIAGYFTGRELGFRDTLRLNGYLVPWSLVLCVVALVRGFISPIHRSEAGHAGLLLVFVIFSECGFPVWFGTVGGVLINVAWLVPLLIGALVLPRRREWLAAWSYWQILFIAATIFSHNFHHWHCGVHFFGGWIS